MSEPSPAQRALYATNANRLRKAWTIARYLATNPRVAQSPYLDRAPDDFKVLVVRQSGVNPRMPSAHTWRLAVALAQRLARTSVQECNR